MISVFELFSIGVGPSSSHTVGPMRAAKQFVTHLSQQQKLSAVVTVRTFLYGSLALTGKGHGTDLAVLMGLEGYTPEAIDPLFIPERLRQIRHQKKLKLAQTQEITFHESEHLLFLTHEALAYHSNALRFEALDVRGALLCSEVYYSVGGGFIVHEQELTPGVGGGAPPKAPVPYPFQTAKELLNHCQREQASISDIVWANERAWQRSEEISRRLQAIWTTMSGCIQAGCQHEGLLPGGLQVRRRAPGLYQQLLAKQATGAAAALDAMAWLNCYAMAVNEENAAGGRVVTAPTNGAAGIIPAVLKYYVTFCPTATPEGVERFLLTAGGIGILYKERASISGAEVGCQGEVGVACSMASGALAEAMGGTVMQVENAAEMGMEHHLGLTCDPIGGLVQIPCIERNGLAAVRAVNVAQLALMETGEHKVSLDKVIATMAQTGRDMMTIYKETSQGGLAVNHSEC